MCLKGEGMSKSSVVMTTITKLTPWAYKCSCHYCNTIQFTAAKIILRDGGWVLPCWLTTADAGTVLPWG